MMTQTHGVTGLAVWMTADAIIRACGLDHPYHATLIGAGIAWSAAKAPDVDTPDSHPGRQLNKLVPGLSNLFESAFGHRGVTHWATTGLVNGITVGTIACLINPSLWWAGLAVTVGWITHIAGDCCTYRGAPAFGPFRRDMIRIPYGYRIECGGPIETRFVYPAALVWALSTSATSVALTMFD